MIFKYECGHTGTEGYWKDDDWQPARGLCSACAKKQEALRAGFRLVVKGSGKVLCIKLVAHVVER